MLAVMIILGALLSGLVIALSIRFANEVFEFTLDSEDPYIIGFVATFVAGGLGALLHFWLGVPSALLFIATPITTLALLAAGIGAFWVFTRGFSKLDDFIVAQGRLVRDRLNENHEDRNA